MVDGCWMCSLHDCLRRGGGDGRDENCQKAHYIGQRPEQVDILYDGPGCDDWLFRWPVPVGPPNAMPVLRVRPPL
jgi:hypothetical protein